MEPLGETSAQRLLDSQWWMQVSPGTSSAHRETRHWVSQWVCQPGAHRSPVFSPGLCCFSHSANHLPPSYPLIHCILLLSHQLNFMSSVTSSINLLSSSSSFLLVSVPIFIGWVMFCFVLQSRGYCGGNCADIIWQMYWSISNKPMMVRHQSWRLTLK